MSDGSKTRKVTAVKRRPVSEQATVRRPAVSRTPVDGPTLLPEALKRARIISFREKPRLGFAGSDYALDVGGSVELLARARLGLVRGWQYDFVEDEQVLFSMKRGKHLLLLERLTVKGANGQLLATFVQRATGLSVHIEVFDAAGSPKLELRQPEDVWSQFDVSRAGVVIATLVRSDRRSGLIEFRDERVDDFERLLTLAAAVFVALVYFSPGDE